MKYLHQYKNWISENRFEREYLVGLDENLQAAKSYMVKKFATRVQKQPADLTPEEQAKALKDREYIAIQTMLGQKYLGFIFPFVRFRFEQNISIADLQLLLNELVKYRQVLNTLPYPIEKYAEGNPDPNSTALTGFEALMDKFRTFEFNKVGKWIVDSLPKALRDQARSLNPEEMNKLIRLGWDIADKGEEIKKRVISKVSRYTNLQDFIKYATDISTADEGSAKLVSQAESLAPEIVVMYDDNNYVVFSVRTEAAQKKIFRMANWCLNTGSWNTYVSQGVQLNILNFNLPPSDPMYITGTTVLSGDSSVKASHDANDRNIKKSEEPRAHLLANGYPEDLVNTIMEILPTELTVKLILAKVISKTDPKSKIQALASAGHDLEVLEDAPLKTQVEKDLVTIIDSEFEAENFSTDSMIEAFKQYGILSKFAAQIYNRVLRGKISEEDKAAIFAKTNRGFELIAASGSNWNDQKTRTKMMSILANKDEILRLAQTV